MFADNAYEEATLAVLRRLAAEPCSFDALGYATGYAILVFPPVDRQDCLELISEMALPGKRHRDHRRCDRKCGWSWSAITTGI